MRALFISDLHLMASDHATTQRFERFMQGPARTPDALYVLGDIFDAWVGDDQLDHDPYARAIAERFANNCAAGIPTYLLGGNRDFLIGERFAKACGARLLPSQWVTVMDGTRIVLMHGDELCTDDIEYQNMRTAMSRNPQWCAHFLSQPYAARQAVAAKLRGESEMAKSGKAAEIMDTNARAVSRAFQRTGASLLIHGHTHRPHLHQTQVDGRDCQRVVLSDWQGGDGFLEWADGQLIQRPWPSVT
jgi:UDP-2,3-diacylglucosamine hydrolase